MSIETLEQWRDPAVVEGIAKLHYRLLPFHNFPHALDTREGVREEAEACRQAGEPFDPEEQEDAEIAALFHDAGFYIPPHLHGFRSKEEFSAWIATNEQRRLGMPEPRIARMSSFILGTEKGVAPIGKGGKAVRRGDLRNVAHNSPLAVIKKSLSLFKEENLLRKDYDHPGEVLTDPIGFVMGSYSILREFNEDDVALGEFDIDPNNGVCYFTNQVDEKLPYFLQPRVNALLKRLGIAATSKKEAS